jgi:hypothetical protein
MIDRGVVDDGLVVNIVNVRASHIVHRAVIVEGPVIPISASIANPAIAETVVDPTVEANMVAPVADIPGVGIATPTPITGSPEQANFGSHYPRTWNPKVALVTVCPVTGRPQITITRNHGLRVHRKRRRCDRDRNAELRERGGWYSQY